MTSPANAMFERLRFASSYVYSPKGQGRVSVQSRLLCRVLKTAEVRFFPHYAARVRQLIAADPHLHEFFGADAVLVPVPGRRPQPQCATTAERLAHALLDAQIGHSAWCGLRRVRAVPKSATALPHARPSVERHYESFAVDSAPAQHAHLVLIDDVVTKGRTLLAAAWRLHEVFPSAHISAFAMLRTLGHVEDVPALIAPCRGEIRWLHGDAYRNP